MKFEAVIFDMDGLLLDTERVALETFQQACRNFNLSVDENLYLQCVGATGSKTREVLQRAFGESLLCEDFIPAWSDMYAKEISEKGLCLKPGARELLERLKGEGVPVGLATSTARASAVTRLHGAGLLDFFGCIVAGDEVSQGKPHPEIYLKAARGLGVPAAGCLAIEDSDHGVRSAIAAGMVVIQVPDLVQPADDVRSLGHTILETLQEVDRYLQLGGRQLRGPFSGQGQGI